LKHADVTSLTKGKSISDDAKAAIAQAEGAAKKIEGDVKKSVGK
jgi:uncharacterized protein YjbJ (UPF0337 family)